MILNVKYMKCDVSKFFNQNWITVVKCKEKVWKFQVYFEKLMMKKLEIWKYTTFESKLNTRRPT